MVAPIRQFLFRADRRHNRDVAPGAGECHQHPYRVDLEDLLFVLMTIGDDRAVRATYVAGHEVYDRDGEFSYADPLSDSPM